MSSAKTYQDGLDEESCPTLIELSRVEAPASSRETKEAPSHGKVEATDPLDVTRKEDEDHNGPPFVAASPVLHAQGICAERARRWLYVSHGFAQLSEVAWQFSLAFFFAAISNYQSLFWVSTYGLSQAAAVSLATPIVGRWMDEQNLAPVNQSSRLRHGNHEAIPQNDDTEEEEEDDSQPPLQQVPRERLNRLQVAQRIMLFETMSVFLASIASYLLLWHAQPTDSNSRSTTGNPATSRNDLDNVAEDDDVTLSLGSLIALVVIHLFGSIAQVCDQSFTVAMERDWIVQLGQSVDDLAAARMVSTSSNSSVSVDNENNMSDATTNNSDGAINESSSSSWLSKTNVVMCQLDLTAKIVAPAMAGWIIPWLAGAGKSSMSDRSNDDGSEQPQARDLTSSALGVGVLNLVALLVQYIATKQIYHLMSFALAPSSSSNILQHSSDHDHRPSYTKIPHSIDKKNSEVGDQANKDDDGDGYANRCSRSCTEGGLVAYFFELDSVCWSSGLAMGLLYVNGVTFGNGILSTYLLYRGLKLETVGILRGFASAIGLAGTIVFSWSVQRMSLITTGMWSIVYEFVCLCVMYSSLFIDDKNHNDEYNDATTASISTWSLVLLVGGVCASRIGLWVFDIAVTQLQQERVPSHLRGVIGGVQQSLNAFFGILCFTLGIVFPDAKDFYAYMSAAVGSVGLAMCLYAFGSFGPTRGT